MAARSLAPLVVCARVTANGAGKVFSIYNGIEKAL